MKNTYQKSYGLSIILIDLISIFLTFSNIRQPLLLIPFMYCIVILAGIYYVYKNHFTSKSQLSMIVLNAIICIISYYRVVSSDTIKVSTLFYLSNILLFIQGIRLLFSSQTKKTLNYKKTIDIKKITNITIIISIFSFIMFIPLYFAFNRMNLYMISAFSIILILLQFLLYIIYTKNNFFKEVRASTIISILLTSIIWRSSFITDYAFLDNISILPAVICIGSQGALLKIGQIQRILNKKE